MAIFPKKDKEKILTDNPETQPPEQADKIGLAERERGQAAEALPEVSVPTEAASHAEETQPNQSNTPGQAGQMGQATVKSEELTAIEHILEEDIGESFAQMDYKHQQIFKRAGELTATQIEKMFLQAKLKVQKIFELIRAWLVLIPGVNKWFVLQESKIKTDKIMKIKKETQRSDK